MIKEVAAGNVVNQESKEAAICRCICWSWPSYFPWWEMDFNVWLNIPV